MLNYHVQGTGDQVIVFITGAGVSKWMWQKQLVIQAKLITFDLPGHGDNFQTDFVSIKSTVRDIQDILKSEGLTSAIFVGHSIGSQIIMYMMEHLPEMIEQAVVISGLNKPSKLLSLFARPMVALSMPLTKKEAFARAQSKQLALPDYMFEDYFKDSLLLSKETLINIMKENQTFSFTGTRLQGEHVHFLVGSTELKMMKDSVLKTHKIVKGSSFTELNAGHGIPYEMPDKLNELIETLLKR